MRKAHNLKGTIIFLATTILLVAVSAFCITGTVISQTDIGAQELENYYREQEKELLCQAREQLNALGYTNSGVTLTRVVDEIGNREYTFTIHHRKIDKMSMEERADLAAELASDIVLTENCSFYHEFLMYD